MSQFRKKQIGTWLLQSDSPKSLHFRENHNFYKCTSTIPSCSDTFILECLPLSEFNRMDEFLLLSKIKHENLLEIRDVRKTINNFYIVYESFIEDYELLGSYLQKHSSGLPLEQTLLISLEIIEGIGELNKKGLMLRSLSPNSVMLNRGKYKLCGFETVKKAEGLIHFSNSFKAIDETDQLYLAPDLAEKTYGFNCDVYSIGILMLELLQGRNNLQKIKGKVILTDINPEIANIIGGLVNEGQMRRESLEIVRKKLQNLQSRLKAPLNKSPSIKAPLNKSLPLNLTENITKLSTNKQKIMNSVIEESNVEICSFEESIKKKPISTEKEHFLSYLRIFSEELGNKVLELNDLTEKLRMNNKNISIYQTVYLIIRLDLALKRKLCDLTSPREKSLQTDLQFTKEKVLSLNSFFLPNSSSFSPIIQKLINNEKDLLTKKELYLISEELLGFVAKAFRQKGKKKSLLLFLEGLAWLVKRHRMKEEVFGMNQVPLDKTTKYYERKKKLSERKEGNIELNASELKEKIWDYIKEIEENKTEE